MQTRISSDKLGEAVMRIANDEQLREHAMNAYESAMAAYSRIQDKGSRAATDKKVSDDIYKAATELQDAARRLAPERHRGRGFMRLVVLGAIIGAAAYGAKRAMSTDEDEFEYTP